MADYLTLTDLRTAVSDAIKALGSTKIDLIDSMINMAYYELLQADDLYPPFWLTDFDDTLACVAPMTITAISAADPGVITVDEAHGLATSDIVGVFGIVGTSVLNNRLYLVNSVPATTTLSLIDLDSLDAIDTTSMTAWSSGGTILHMGKVLATTGKEVQRILSAEWHDEGKMTEITWEGLREAISLWNNTQGRPSRYMHRKQYTAAGGETNQLLWFRGADAAYDLRYWFEKRPARLTAVGNVPLLPPQNHYGIVAGAITRLAESNVQVENAVVWPEIYKLHLNQVAAFNRKLWKRNEYDGRRPPYLL